MKPKVAILKPLSAAIAIGTGGPFGAEGPIIQTGGAMGSLIGQIISTTASERKVLLACGAGAGMAATFNTPIAGVILAIELLLFEFRSRSFIPLVIACTLATSVRSVLLGQRSMFTMRNVNFDALHGLPFYLLLGVLSGVAAICFTKALYWVEDQFDRLPINDLWHPAIGALGLGIIGFFVPRVLGVGYDTISDILNNNLALKLLLSDCDFQGARVDDLARFGNFRRFARSHVYVERGAGRVFRYRRKLDFPQRTSFAGSLRAGGHGCSFRRSVPRHVCVHRLCV